MIKTKIRIFKSGAFRNSDKGKLDHEGFLNPLVIERFSQYLDKHRVMEDGTMRDSDNWQGFFGEKHKDICMKSAWRHFLSWWKAHRGYKTEEEIEDSICGVIFNANAYLLKLLTDKQNGRK